MRKEGRDSLRAVPESGTARRLRERRTWDICKHAKIYHRIFPTEAWLMSWQQQQQIFTPIFASNIRNAANVPSPSLSRRIWTYFSPWWHSRQSKRLSPQGLWVWFSLRTHVKRASQCSAESRGFSPDALVSSHKESWQGGLGTGHKVTAIGWAGGKSQILPISLVTHLRK
jgi:hypothetical protein